MHAFRFVSVIVQLLLWAGVAAVDYEIAVQKPDGELVKWSTLRVDPQEPNEFTYEPNNDAEPVAAGCVGVIEPLGFTCQTLFQQDPAGPRQAIGAYINSDGTLQQVQLIEGPRAHASLKFPEIVTAPVYSKPAAAGARGQKANTAEPAGAEAEVPEKSVFENYWIYILPIGILLLTNLASPSKNAAAE